MARERSNHEEWETENQPPESEAQITGDQSLSGPTTSYGHSRRYILPDRSALEDQPADWSDQPTQPQRRIQAGHDWPDRSTGNRVEWPIRTASTAAKTSFLHRLLDAAQERQFNLGCGTLAALVLIVAALLAAFSNGWLPTNAGPLDSQPSIQANPIQPTAPMPTVTPRPSPTATTVPTDTPFPTITPYPTVTPFPTVTPMPTATPLPTETPVSTQQPTTLPAPAQPTATPAIQNLPAPTATPAK